LLDHFYFKVSLKILLDHELCNFKKCTVAAGKFKSSINLNTKHCTKKYICLASNYLIQLQASSRYNQCCFGWKSANNTCFNCSSRTSAW